MNSLEQHFPEDMEWEIVYDTTMFVRASITEVIKTMLQAVGLVLHLVICLLLFAVLKHLARLGDAAAGGPPPAAAWSAGDYLPYVLTAFFALNPAVMELVIWAHLHGYLLFLALFR